MGRLVQRNKAEGLHFTGVHALGNALIRGLRVCLCVGLLVTLTSLPGEVSTERQMTGKKMAQEVDRSLVLDTPRLKLSVGASLGWVPMDYEFGCFTTDRVMGVRSGVVYWAMACLADRMGERKNSGGGLNLFRPGDAPALAMIDISLFSLEWAPRGRASPDKVPVAC